MNETAAPEYTAAEVAVQRVDPNPWLVGLAASPLLITLAVLVGGLFNPQVLLGVMHPTILAAFGLSYVLLRKPMARKRLMRARIDESSLLLDDEPAVALSDVKSAAVAPRLDGSARVRISQRGMKLPVELEVRNPEEGRVLLRGMGHDVSQRAVSFRAASLLRRKWWYGLIFMMSAMVLSAVVAMALAFITPLLAPAGMLMMMAAAFSMLIPSKVSVGTDGVLLRWLWHQQLIDTADIAHVRTGEVGGGRSRTSAVFLTLADGSEITLPVSSVLWDSGQAAQLAQRIIDACNMRAAARGTTVAELRRNERDTTSWLRALRNLGQGANVHHRSGHIPRDQLWRVVEDLGASAQDRAAAAMALHDQLDAPERARLQAAARATAGPKLRIALDAAADEALAEEELAAALEQLESEKRA